VPGVRGDEPHRHAVRGIGAAEEILDEHLPGIEIGPHIFVQTLEGRGLQPGVFLPPDLVAPARLLDDEFVLRGAAGVGGRDGSEGAAVGQHPLAA
jgi:hypothetical protein